MAAIKESGMTTKTKKPTRLPGDPSKAEMVERTVRVNQAGEYGAVKIYEGQLAVLGKTAAGPIIEEMLEKEREHLKAFNVLLAERRVRPTALMPLWHFAGFMLGASSALLGKKTAMACTVAIEETIDEHYAEQIAALGPYADEAELREICVQFRDDELEHRDTGLEHGATDAPGYKFLSAAVKTGSRMAIWLSARI
jgi:ubiquinone biosynthesis monooxygenase Coq7